MNRPPVDWSKNMGTVDQRWLDSFGREGTICEECHDWLRVGQPIVYLDPEGNRARHVDCSEAEQRD